MQNFIGFDWVRTLESLPLSSKGQFPSLPSSRTLSSIPRPTETVIDLPKLENYGVKGGIRIYHYTEGRDFPHNSEVTPLSTLSVKDKTFCRRKRYTSLCSRNSSLTYKKRGHPEGTRNKSHPRRFRLHLDIWYLGVLVSTFLEVT